jgi:hypothetical protein
VHNPQLQFLAFHRTDTPTLIFSVALDLSIPDKQSPCLFLFLFFFSFSSEKKKNHVFSDKKHVFCTDAPILIFSVALSGTAVSSMTSGGIKPILETFFLCFSFCCFCECGVFWKPTTSKIQHERDVREV